MQVAAHLPLTCCTQILAPAADFHVLQIGEVVTTIPTIGFNVESVTYKNLNFNVWDLGGQTSIRPYWRCYYANTAAVIFVVDSTDIERLQTAAEELGAMLNEDELKDAALLVFANKQDQPGAKGAGEISEALRLGELRDRNWSIMACSAVDGSGVSEGMDWLVVSNIRFYFILISLLVGAFLGFVFSAESYVTRMRIMQCFVSLSRETTPLFSGSLIHQN